MSFPIDRYRKIEAGDSIGEGDEVFLHSQIDRSYTKHLVQRNELIGLYIDDEFGWLRVEPLIRFGRLFLAPLPVVVFLNCADDRLGRQIANAVYRVVGQENAAVAYLDAGDPLSNMTIEQVNALEPTE